MRKALCLLNHKLTKVQLFELENTFGISEVVYPNYAIQGAWADIPTTPTLTKDNLKPFVEWMLKNAQRDDIVILQGEFGASFYLIECAFENDLIPIHSVTKRIAKEGSHDETIVRTYVFTHICFRKYIKYGY